MLQFFVSQTVRVGADLAKSRLQDRRRSPLAPVSLREVVAETRSLRERCVDIAEDVIARGDRVWSEVERAGVAPALVLCGASASQLRKTPGGRGIGEALRDWCTELKGAMSGRGPGTGREHRAYIKLLTRLGADVSDAGFIPILFPLDEYGRREPSLYANSHDGLLERVARIHPEDLQGIWIPPAKVDNEPLQLSPADPAQKGTLDPNDRVAPTPDLGREHRRPTFR